MLQINCHKFYKALEEIQNRLPLKTESLLGEMELLNPMAAFGENKEEYKFFYLLQKFDLNSIHIFGDLIHFIFRE